MVSNHLIEKANLEPCYRVEADDRMFLRAKELSRLGFRKLTVISVDSYWHIDVDELWVEFGWGRDRKWLPIHIYANLWERKYAWLYHSGMSLQVSGRANKIAWKAWSSFSEVTETFSRLSSSNALSKTDIEILEKFVVLMYDVTRPVV